MKIIVTLFDLALLCFCIYLAINGNVLLAVGVFVGVILLQALIACKIGSFIKTSLQTGKRNKSADAFCRKYESRFNTKLSSDLLKSYKNCLLYIHSASNNGPIEDCVNFLSRELEIILSSTITTEEKKYMISSLQEECNNLGPQRFTFWGLKGVIDNALLKL